MPGDTDRHIGLTIFLQFYAYFSSIVKALTAVPPVPEHERHLDQEDDQEGRGPRDPHDGADVVLDPGHVPDQGRDAGVRVNHQNYVNGGVGASRIIFDDCINSHIFHDIAHDYNGSDYDSYWLN